MRGVGREICGPHERSLSDALPSSHCVDDAVVGSSYSGLPVRCRLCLHPSALRRRRKHAELAAGLRVCAEMNHAEEWHRAAMQSAELGGAVIGRLFCELQVLRLEVKRLADRVWQLEQQQRKQQIEAPGSEGFGEGDMADTGLSDVDSEELHDRRCR